MVKGEYCIVCVSNKENVNPSSPFHSLFNFPKSPTRRKKWTDKLQIEENEIKKGSRVCQLHFRKNQFVTVRLKKTAVPTIRFCTINYKLSDQVQTSATSSVIVTPLFVLPQQPLIRYTPPAEPQHVTNATVLKSLQRSELMNRLDKIKSRRQSQTRKKDKQKIARLKNQVAELKAKLKRSTDVKEAFSSNPAFRNIIEGQIQRYKQRKQHYTESEKTIALSIYYSCGPNGYSTLQKMGFLLPSRRSLQDWTSHLQISVGLNQPLLDCLKQIVSTFGEKDHDCLITWDEMSIKEYVEYNKYYDMFEGITDFGKYGRRLESANEVLVFMVRGINSTWKFPISYYFSKHSTTSEMLNNLVTDNITAIQNVGLNVRVGVCDMSFCNQGLYRQWSISNSTPFRVFNERKVYLIHDTPHLLKLVRNNLMKHNFVVQNYSQNSLLKVKWSHISGFYNKDQRVKSRMAPKLTHAHINPGNYSKMKVKLATQVLSMSVYAGIKTMARLKILKKDFMDTAIFVRKIDEIFDFLNTSAVWNDKSSRCALNFYRDMEKIDDYILFIQSISIPTCYRDPEFLKGLELNLTAIKLLALDLKNEGYPYLLTRHIQQDCLENYFSLVRSKGGYSRNPTARSFRSNFRFLFFATLIHTPSTGNVEVTMEGFTKYVENMKHFMNVGKKNKNQKQTTNTDGLSDNTVLNSKDAAGFYTIKLARKLKFGSEQEAEVASYLGAASICAQLKLNQCTRCKRMLINSSELGTTKYDKHFLIDFKQYGDHGLSYLRTTENMFFQNTNSLFTKYACDALNVSGTNVVSNILELYETNETVLKWLADGCHDHRKLILEYFVRAKLYRVIKDKNSELRQIKSWEQSRRDLRNQ